LGLAEWSKNLHYRGGGKYDQVPEVPETGLTVAGRAKNMWGGDGSGVDRKGKAQTSLNVFLRPLGYTQRRGVGGGENGEKEVH